MSVAQQAQNLGFPPVGELVRCPEWELSDRYRCYLDSLGNLFILYRGILTILTADGRVY